MENLLLYNITNSKKAVNLLGDSGPYGCYDTVKEWLCNQSMDPLPFPQNDCVVIFDNNQVIGRSWRVKVNNKVKSSVVTTICQIEFPDQNLQRQIHLKPKFWNVNTNQLVKCVRDIPEEVTDVHYKHLYEALAANLKLVVEQQQCLEANNSYQDPIDLQVTQQRKEEATKVCCQCGHVNLRTKRICGACKANLKQAEAASVDPDGLGTYTARCRATERKMKEVRMTASKTDDGQYIIRQATTSNDHCQSNSKHPDTSPLLTLSDPCFVNPNSYNSARTILRQIGVQGGIKQYSKEGDREWLFVVCDGLPFGLCKQVINNTYRCQHCTDSTEYFNSREEFCEHHQEAHPDKTEKGFLEFEWVVLRPGNGHFEMNMCKTFVELNWDVFFSDLCRIMGFRSENAQRAAKKCSDHHKTWSLLKIAHEGTLQELMVPYVRKAMQEKRMISPRGFLKFVMVEAKNPNYVYLATMTMTYLQALKNFRAGLRAGDIDAITSGKAVFAPLFHARNHPHYQDIEMTEAIQRQSVPAEVVSSFNQTESVCLSEDKTSGEGLDFKAEVVNKDVQSWMPRGVPTGDDWLRVTRNLENLKEIRKRAYEMMCSSATSTNQRSNQSTSSRSNLSEQIFAWRVHLRSKDYLADPCDATVDHVSLTSEELDPSLIDITARAENLRKKYFDKLCLGETSEDMAPEPVYVTKKERMEKSLISNKSKSEIYDVIVSLLETVCNPDLKHSLKLEFREMVPISKVKKCDLLKFREIVNDVCSQQDDVILQEDM
ncbi:uncharacterized protein LOC134231718 [Saccostrea cucullata]|uniref:uncharacterized protein LOC134231718 n=1 Tax=Saccostrea cuccullata TaxID=36930 RepID=UPI002ED5E23E